MRRLLLLRHAKSDWDAGARDDHERPLAGRGRRAAATIGHFLADADAVPDVAISSTAVRARTTLELAAEAGRWTTELRTDRDLYLPSLAAVVRVLQSAPDAAASVMLVGHEPTWSSAVSAFAGGGAARMPTAACACIDLPIAHWADAGGRAGELQWLVTPRLLGGRGGDG